MLYIYFHVNLKKKSIFLKFWALVSGLDHGSIKENICYCYELMCKNRGRTRTQWWHAALRGSQLLPGGWEGAVGRERWAISGHTCISLLHESLHCSIWLSMMLASIWLLQNIIHQNKLTYLSWKWLISYFRYFICKFALVGKCSNAFSLLFQLLWVTNYSQI